MPSRTPTPATAPSRAVMNAGRLASAPRRPIRRVIALVTAALAALATLTSAHALAAPLTPAQDPFYAWAPSLQGVAPGTVLRVRQITFNASGLTVPVQADQLLFASRDELGHPAVGVTTVVQPTIGATGKVISYQWAYDGLAGNCDPSYAIQGGTPTEGTNSAEQSLEVPMLSAGDTVVTTDYEGENNQFVAGREEGRITLDGIRAAESFLGLPARTQVAMMGYSGGAIATDWAAELAPTYAPTLDFVGAAYGGIAVDLAHNLTYVNGSQEWSGSVPAALLGIARSLHIDLARYLNAYGRKIMREVGTSCLESDLGHFPGLTYQQLLKRRYTNIDQIPVFVHAIDSLIMGTAGTPEEPLYMGVGNADGTGDDVMIAADDYALAHTYCNRGVPVQFTTYKGQNHGNAGIAFLPSAEQWVIGRLNGNPAVNGCAQIPPGDSLAPLAAAPQAAASITVGVSLLHHGARRIVLLLRVSHRAATLSVRLIGPRGRTLITRHVRVRPGRARRLVLAPQHPLRAGRYRVVVAAPGAHRFRTVRFRLRR
ncbi:MAG TPA: lipase family protein [Solirubrobacteraceae bacterium]|nr:lipase family protein [Solirubrobacteraceae bacterium]